MRRAFTSVNLIKALGLPKQSDVQSKTTNGVRRRGLRASATGAMGRSGDFNVVEVDDDVPNLVGQIPLEYLDFVVDPRRSDLARTRGQADERGILRE